MSNALESVLSFRLTYFVYCSKVLERKRGKRERPRERERESER